MGGKSSARARKRAAAADRRDNVSATIPNRIVAARIALEATQKVKYAIRIRVHQVDTNSVTK